MDYSLPLPKKSLKLRFGSHFFHLSRNLNTTLVALPFTGRTSLLRYIVSQPQLLSDLGLDQKSHSLFLLDIDKTRDTYLSVISEFLISLAPESSFIINTADEYLITHQLHSAVASQTQNQPISCIITLNWKTLSFLTDLDRLLVTLQKSATTHPLTYFWSIDTIIYRHLSKLHPSSTLTENVSFYLPFSESETIHSLTRLSLAKNKPLSPLLASQAFNLTGGIAGTFHTFINSYINFSSQPSAIETLAFLKSELQQCTAFSNHIITPAAEKVLKTSPNPKFTFGQFELTSSPTAQEISLLRLFQTQLNLPVSREQIAVCLWNKNIKTKYSDWAIDKAVSRLRKLIASPNFKLTTVKNLGYQLNQLT